MQQMVICLQGQCTRVKTLEAISLRLTQEFCGCCSLTLRVSAIRLSSGSERAFIFRIRWVRCTFTVDSAIPISLAICTAHFDTSRARRSNCSSQKSDFKKLIGRNLAMACSSCPIPAILGGEITIGYTSGHAESFSEYGHKPWQKGYKDERRFAKESAALDRFKAEFAKHQGPVHRGSGFSFNKPPPHVDSDDYHAHLIAKTKGGRRWGHS